MTAPRQAAQGPETVHTCDGREYQIRPIRPDDIDRERAFIAAMSPQSRYQRFLYAMREPSAEMLARLVNVDMHRTLALVATVGAGDDERIIGVTRYAADADGSDCEFAVAVADDWQRCGIGTALATRLFAAAAAEGFENIYGNMLADNDRMIALARALGLQVSPPTRGQSQVRAWRRLR